MNGGERRGKEGSGEFIGWREWSGSMDGRGMTFEGRGEKCRAGRDGFGNHRFDSDCIEREAMATRSESVCLSLEIRFESGFRTRPTPSIPQMAMEGSGQGTPA